MKFPFAFQTCWLAIGLVALSGAAFAAAPVDIADLVGARAAGAESEIQARGYDNVKNNIWWNGATNTCVQVHVSQGKYARIDIIDAGNCGQGAASSGSSGDVPQAALDACSKRADEFQNATRGSSAVNGAKRSGPNWVLKMATGTYSSTCTVTGSGKVVNIEPGS